MNTIGASGATGFNLYSLLVAIGGAVVLLFLIRVFRRAVYEWALKPFRKE